MPDEELRRIGRRATVSEVVDNGVANIRKQRQPNRFSGFALGQLDDALIPKQIVDSKESDVAGAKPKTTGYQQDRIIAQANGDGPVNTRQHLFKFGTSPQRWRGITPGSRNAGQPIMERAPKFAKDKDDPGQCSQSRHPALSRTTRQMSIGP